MSEVPLYGMWSAASLSSGSASCRGRQGSTRNEPNRVGHWAFILHQTYVHQPAFPPRSTTDLVHFVPVVAGLLERFPTERAVADATGASSRGISPGGGRCLVRRLVVDHVHLLSRGGITISVHLA